LINLVLLFAKNANKFVPDMRSGSRHENFPKTPEQWLKSVFIPAVPGAYLLKQNTLA
jgi:hypothetical protein